MPNPLTDTTNVLMLDDRNFVGGYLDMMADHQSDGAFPPTAQDIQVLKAAAKLLDVVSESRALKMAEEWKGRADDAGQLARAVLEAGGA